MGFCQFVDRVPTSTELARFTAAIVMDEFVTADVVTTLSNALPVIVIAWNGLFEIERYDQALGRREVLYVGPEQTINADVSYTTMIDESCPFMAWRERYAARRAFSVSGDWSYQLRWLRTKAMGSRAMNVAIAAAGAARRPPVLRATLRSAAVKHRIVWAGLCYLDESVGLSTQQLAEIRDEIAAIRAKPTPEGSLSAGLAAIAARRAMLRPQTAHRDFYVINTLLRWTALNYLMRTVRSATWFFGRENMGLGLPHELYVHNLVPTQGVAFLELGGTKTGDTMYPRALHLLAREFYVISIPADGGGGVASTLERIRAGIAQGRELFFTDLDRRRQALYQRVPAATTITCVHDRVWKDFSGA